jgi:FkbM family methyltransferase
MAKHADLIYDVGFHHGEDTAYYLKKGFRVVAFEAHPRLAEKGRAMFADAARDGRFTMVEGAIVSGDDWTAGKRTATFYMNNAWDTWGTTQPAFAERFNQAGGSSQPVTVTTVDFFDCLRTYGVPHFMKVDIEGSDRFCLESLRYFAERPDFLSIESERSDMDRAQMELDLLDSLGYGGFQIVQQSRVPWQKVPEPPREGTACTHRFVLDASGLFGADLPAEGWVDRDGIVTIYEKIFARQRAFGDGSPLLHVPGMRRFLWTIEKYTGLPLPGWYDTHARLAPA